MNDGGNPLRLPRRKAACCLGNCRLDTRLALLDVAEAEVASLRAEPQGATELLVLFESGKGAQRLRQKIPFGLRDGTEAGALGIPLPQALQQCVFARKVPVDRSLCHARLLRERRIGELLKTAVFHQLPRGVQDTLARSLLLLFAKRALVCRLQRYCLDVSHCVIDGAGCR